MPLHVKYDMYRKYSGSAVFFVMSITEVFRQWNQPTRLPGVSVALVQEQLKVEIKIYI